MNDKKEFKQKRDELQQFIYKLINPLVILMIKVGITPNIITTIGFLGNVLAAGIFICAAHSPSTPNFCLVGWGGVIILIFSFFDILDGQVARLGGKKSPFGAMYDSVLDRYSELFTLGSICYFLLKIGSSIGALVAFIALIGSIMVSYVRARAESLGIECKIGFMQRPERVVLTSVAAIVCGIVGSFMTSNTFDATWILIIAMGIIAIFANITALARINHCRRQMRQ